MGRKKSWKKPKYPRSSRQESQADFNEPHYDPTVFAEVESLFKKQFTYEAQGGDWVLPAVDAWFMGETWSDAELVQNKETMNGVKSTLSDKDINQWHEHTQFTNRAGAVIQNVRRSRKPELCTQAWCKFHEIIASFPILPPSVQMIVSPEDSIHIEGSTGPGLPAETPAEFRSVHLCEAPGAFVASLNHYLQTRGYHGEWQWTGNTLNPYYEGNNLSEMITDDRLILDTLPNWYFGPDNSGNILHAENIQGLRDHVVSAGLAHLVTCDGSIDCQNQPDQQEALVSPLHYAEVAASLLLLTPGGSLVLKMFTLYEASSVCLMYLLNCVFTKVHVFKPATSKSGNSEVYVICLGYKGCEDAVTERLLQATSKELPVSPMFRQEDIPDSYMSAHRRCCQVFMKLQTQTIEDNLDLFHTMTADKRSHLTAVRQHCASNFIDRFNIRLLPTHAYLVPPFHTVGGGGWTKTHQTRSRKCHTGSYSDRVTLLGMSWEERLQHASLYNVQPDNLGALMGEGELENENLTAWPVTCGLVPERVASSQFCDSGILNWYNELLSQQQQDKQTSRIDFTEVSSFLETICPTSMDEGQGTQKIMVCQLDSDQGPLIEYLRKLDQFQVEQQESADDQTNRVFVLESGVARRCTHSWSKNNVSLFKALHEMYQTVAAGDHCILLLPDLLTRLSVGLLYLLFSSFHQVCVKPVSADVAAPLAVIGQACRTDDCQPILMWLTELITTITSLQDKSHGVLQITPIHALFQSQFYEYVCSCNETLLMARSDHMLQLQRQEILKPEKNPTKADNSKHLDDIEITDDLTKR